MWASALVLLTSEFCQLLYINVFDTVKYPGNSWERIDYDPADRRKLVKAAPRPPSHLFKSEEAEASNNGWRGARASPAYIGAERAACHLAYGIHAPCY